MEKSPLPLFAVPQHPLPGFCPPCQPLSGTTEVGRSSGRLEELSQGMQRFSWKKIVYVAVYVLCSFLDREHFQLEGDSGAQCQQGSADTTESDRQGWRCRAQGLPYR